jgi:hypothetical protein
MEQSSISTNVTIDFNKKPIETKRTYKPRVPTVPMPTPTIKKPEHAKVEPDFIPKAGEIPVKV